MRLWAASLKKKQGGLRYGRLFSETRASPLQTLTSHELGCGTGTGTRLCARRYPINIGVASLLAGLLMSHQKPGVPKFFETMENVNHFRWEKKSLSSETDMLGNI